MYCIGVYRLVRVEICIVLYCVVLCCVVLYWGRCRSGENLPRKNSRFLRATLLVVSVGHKDYASNFFVSRAIFF